MKLTRLVGTLAGAYLLTGCAAMSSLGIKAPVGGDIAKAQQLIADADAKAKAKCDPIRNAEVAWPEERAMGGVVSIKQVANFGGLVMDGMSSSDPDALAKDVLAKKPVTLPDSARNDLGAYVAIVGRNLARYSSRPDIAWTFAVMENDTPNAFSSPGGYVVVTTGLLKKVQNEAQLAGVLGHEIGHIVHKHSVKRYRAVKADQCAVATSAAYVIGQGMQAAVSLLPPEARKAADFAKNFENFDLDDPKNGDFVVFLLDAVGKFLELMGNEKEDEFQADATALELVAFAGYDATEYEKFLTTLGEGGGAFSKHPATSERTAKLKTLREGDLAPFATGTAKPDLKKYETIINAASAKK